MTPEQLARLLSALNRVELGMRLAVDGMKNAMDAIVDMRVALAPLVSRRKGKPQ